LLLVATLLPGVLASLLDALAHTLSLGLALRFLSGTFDACLFLIDATVVVAVT
jgi:hypothetical protein